MNKSGVGFVILVLSLAFVGCSVGDKDVTLRLTLGPAPETQSLSSSSSFLTFSGRPIPETARDFDCLLINVVGPGIDSLRPGADPDSILPPLCAGESYCSYLGILSDLIEISSRLISVTLEVPTGPDRVIQVLGVLTESGSCDGFSLFGDPDFDFLIIGQRKLDLDGDETVVIENIYDPTDPMRANCGDDGDDRVGDGSGGEPSPSPSPSPSPDPSPPPDDDSEEFAGRFVSECIGDSVSEEPDGLGYFDDILPEPEPLIKAFTGPYTGAFSLISYVIAQRVIFTLSPPLDSDSPFPLLATIEVRNYYHPSNETRLSNELHIAGDLPPDRDCDPIYYHSSIFYRDVGLLIIPSSSSVPPLPPGTPLLPPGLYDVDLFYHFPASILPVYEGESIGSAASHFTNCFLFDGEPLILGVETPVPDITSEDDCPLLWDIETFFDLFGDDPSIPAPSPLVRFERMEVKGTSLADLILTFGHDLPIGEPPALEGPPESSRPEGIPLDAAEFKLLPEGPL